MGIGLEVSDEESEQEECDDTDNKTNKYSEDEIDNLRRQVQASIEHDETKIIENIMNKTNKLCINDDVVPQLVPAPMKHRETDERETEINNETEQDSEKDKVDKNSQKYRLAMIEKALSDVRSMRSYTSASTIAPEVVKQQVKKNLEVRQKKMERKKAIAKGEASAVTRVRRDNRETIRESHGLWGWDE